MYQSERAFSIHSGGTQKRLGIGKARANKWKSGFKVYLCSTRYPADPLFRTRSGGAKMIDLRNFIMRVNWSGEYIEVGGLRLESRCVKNIMRTIADLINRRNPRVGVTKCRTDLTYGDYKKSQVSAALRLLDTIGILRRERHRC